MLVNEESRLISLNAVKIPKGIDETRFRAGRIHMMHEAAVKKQKQDSLCMNAAKKLITYLKI